MLDTTCSTWQNRVSHCVNLVYEITFRLKNAETHLRRTDFAFVPSSKEDRESCAVVTVIAIEKATSDHFKNLFAPLKSSVLQKNIKMSLRGLAFEEFIHEPCVKNGKFRVKKRVRLHAIEEFAAQQLVVLPILTSPSPLSPLNRHQSFFVVRYSVQCYDF